MAKPAEIAVDLQEQDEEEEDDRVESLDLRQIRTLSGMWDKLHYFTLGYESYWKKKLLKYSFV